MSTRSFACREIWRAEPPCGGESKNADQRTDKAPRLQVVTSARTTARTPRELYEELKARHPFSLAPEMLRVAVNAEFGEWTHALADGDSVVFIPPVAGG